jgi:hypothetical protein
MNSQWLIAIAGGIASALLYMSGVGGPVLLAMVLFLLAPLPIFLVGLGWGPIPVGIAGTVGTLISGLAHGPRLGLVYLVSIAVTVPVICWLAHLRREASAVGGLSPGIEWYPSGRLVAWMAVMAGTLAAGALVSISTDVEQIRAAASLMMERYIKEIPAFANLNAETMSSIFVRVMPAASAASWLTMMLANLWIAGRILRKSGRLARPWPDLSALVLPGWVGLALAAALALGFGSGLIALIANGYAAAFLVAYTVLGLAVLHWITRASSWRPFQLSAAYCAALLLAPYGTILVAAIGLLEPILRLRARAGGGAGTPPAIT